VMTWLSNDPSACWIEDDAMLTDGLADAMRQATALTTSGNVIVYDGLPGALHVSQSLAADLRRAAPAVRADVETNRLPKWLSQRNLPTVTLD